MALSKRQIVRLLSAPLDDLVVEDEAVTRTGLATARWSTVDDTSARHVRKGGVTTQLGDDRFTVFGPAWPSRARRSLPCCGQDTRIA